jgi:hypothetical protein
LLGKPQSPYAASQRRNGNNINQIARSVNAGIATKADAQRGLYLLDQVYDLLYDYIQR